MKKNKFILTLSLLSLLASGIATAAPAQSEPDWYTYLLYVLIGIAGVLVVLLYFLVQLVQTISRQFDPEKEAFHQAYQKQTFWEKLFQLNPQSYESKLLLDENYDGITELNNPTPPWFMFLFYGTILFSVFYMFIYHVAGDGNVQESEYLAEMTQAKAQLEAFRAANASKINEDNVTWLTAASDIEEGKALYTKYCVACHGASGEGKVGPNLTDVYWLHGGSVRDVFRTISNGVPQKGMISWKNQLSPLQIQQVASYIHTMQGTNPPNAKGPEGEVYDPNAEQAPATQQESAAAQTNTNTSSNL